MFTLPPRPAKGFAATAARAGRSVFGMLVNWRRRRRNRLAVKQLLGWNEYMLKDIGLTRADVRCALREHRKVEASGRLRILAVERRATNRAMARAKLSIVTIDGRQTGQSLGTAASTCDA
ncbi:uncharacterized protein DUF1127 [Breoghania corrubedonensis]|uniref:Uncharacterized protein DUF1127 n=1 Tax=Breoghania corrubedonensis TaxID=665038 RepID=A0A2T5VF69_9HYPH|nr:DUF1127 domain-containing protein [Breoghania corrubedonensis]PTW62388.1 uncharacterized protein DUF1127 [Breoghania corrubedonensis]